METAKTWLGSVTYPIFDISVALGKREFKVSHKVLYGLAALGAWQLSKGLGYFLRTFLQCMATCEKTKLTRADGPEDFLNKAVIVVGGDTNIGQAFAKELAKRNFTLILLGHNITILDKLASEIGTNEGVIVRTLQYSLLSNWNELIQLEADLDIIVKPLNVVGVVNAELEMQPDLPFHNIKLKDIVRILGAQVVAPTIITRVAVARMELVKAHGFVLNVTSGLVSQPCSKRPLFAAAASYGDYLSQALNKSYSGRIKFHSVRQMLGESVNEEGYNKFARNCLRWVGSKTVMHGGFLHSLKSNAYSGLLHHFN